MRRRWVFILWLMFAFLSVNCADPNAELREQKRVARRKKMEQDLEEVKLVEETARRWLALVDAGQYKEAWSNAGGLFTSGGKDGDWIAKISSARISVGGFQSRKLLEHYHINSVPGSQIGNYYNLIFSSSFALKPASFEVVYLEKERDEEWKVVGYILK